MISLLSGTKLGRSFGLARMVLLASALFVTLICHAASAETNYTGHYELADIKSDRSFSLEVKQNDTKALVSFSAAMTDGSGAAPDADGKGRVDNGVLTFNFKDSFDNEGTCTLAPAKGGYHLCITVSKVVDSGPFHFYGDILLKKTSNKPREVSN